MGHPQPRHGAADPMDPAAHLRSGLSSSPWALSAQMSAAAAAGIPGYDLHRSLQSAAPTGSHNPYLPPPPPTGTPASLRPHEDPATASLIAAQRHSFLAAAAAAEASNNNPNTPPLDLTKEEDFTKIDQSVCYLQSIWKLNY